MMADVVGYSRLMGFDDAGTVATLKRYRTELWAPTTAAHGGRIIDMAGDSALVEFASVTAALECAVVIQRAMAERNAGLPDDRRMELRLGIHSGEIIVDGNSIFGDDVNVAARIQTLADPGGICVSSKVREAVGGRLSVHFEDLGEHQTKNIAYPIRVWRVRWDEKPASADAARATLPLPAKPSIAVLPFINMSGDAEQEYFADGIVEDVITALSHIKSLFVIARNSSFSYKGSSPDVRRVGRELGVRYVLEGSVRRAGSRVRITGQLVDAASGVHIWADRFDRELDDIFSVQDEIVRKIVGAIDPGIMTAEVQRVQRKDAARLDAWDCTVRAHWHVRRFTSTDSAAAVELLEQALRHDPGSATALGNLAMAHHFRTVFGWSETPLESHAAMGEAARRAVVADQHDAFAQAALAIFELFSGHHGESLRRLERATELNPNLAFARGYLGIAQAFSGEDEAALRHFDEAIRYSPRDPLLCIWYVGKAWACLAASRFAEAIEHARLGIEVNPEFVDLHGVQAAAHGHLGEAAPAAAALMQYQKRMPGLTAGDPRLHRPFKRAEDRERFIDGLVKAGLAR
jgi:adenylate cyclase